jgi:hypothetical protein
MVLQDYDAQEGTLTHMKGASEQYAQGNIETEHYRRLLIKMLEVVDEERLKAVADKLKEGLR